MQEFDDLVLLFREGLISRFFANRYCGKINSLSDAFMDHEILVEFPPEDVPLGNNIRVALLASLEAKKLNPRIGELDPDNDKAVVIMVDTGLPGHCVAIHVTCNWSEGGHTNFAKVNCGVYPPSYLAKK